MSWHIRCVPGIFPDDDDDKKRIAYMVDHVAPEYIQ